MKIIVGIILVALLAIGGAVFLKGDSPALRDEVPDILLIHHESGEEIATSSIEGFAILNSWAVWCPFCVQEVPDFVALQKEFTDVSVVLINRGEDSERVESFLAEIDVHFADLTFLQDPKDSFYKAIGGFSMPETLFVKDGETIFHKRGFMTLSEMKDLTNKLLDGTL